MKRFMIFSLGLFLYPTLCLALSLDVAKQQGAVGETDTGYIAAIAPQAEETVLNLVNDINGKRRKVYQDIAKKNGTKLKEVEILAGAKQMKKTPSGQYVQTASGWKKK